MKPADLFRPKQTWEKAADRYLEMHVIHQELELEARAEGRVEEAEAHHQAARIALKAKNAEEKTE